MMQNRGIRAALILPPPSPVTPQVNGESKGEKEKGMPQLVGHRAAAGHPLCWDRVFGEPQGEGSSGRGTW